MNGERRVFRALEDRQCWMLLRNSEVGRVVYTQNALPAIAPVNYTLHGRDVVIRTAPGSKLDAALRGAVVAFEIDQIDAGARSGWSVVVVGRARVETDAAAIAELDGLRLVTWMPDERPHYVRITAEQVTGRLLDGRLEPPPW
ncbi:pyridoxamine 5'-phosphate oxidase family protein [Actinomadura gamaensis]|uniref:Pyridoxamine 5'-phosphate oxidase family protein n=1 Tax=Actinomadura gamaensis TaxID=1763541 RepID=A0ABV9UBC6_9ACTN